MRRKLIVLAVLQTVCCFMPLKGIFPSYTTDICDVVYAAVKTDSGAKLTAINTADEFLQALSMQSDELNKTFAYRIASAVNVEELINNAKLVYISSIEWTRSYLAGADGNEIPQEYNTYEFTVFYRDDYTVLKADKENSFLDKLTPMELELYKKAMSILAEIVRDEMTDYQKVLAVHDYLILNGKFDVRDTAELPESSYRAEGILLNGVGVCASYASSVNLLLGLLDIECIFVSGEGVDKDGMTELHSWNKVKLDGEWYNVDTTWDDVVPDKPGIVSYVNFCVTDEIMARDHIWDAEAYPQKADAVKYNYYTYHNRLVANYAQFKTVICGEVKARSAEKEIDIYIFVKNYDKNRYDMEFIFDIFADIERISYIEPVESEGEMVIKIFRGL